MNKIQPDEIWLVIDSRLFGGIETHIFELANGLNRCGHPSRVVLIEQYQPLQPLAERLTQHQLPWSFLSQLSERHDGPIGLYQATLHHHPKLLHAHGYKASLYSKLVKLMTFGRIKQLSSYHAGETSVGKMALYDAADRYSAFVSDCAIAVSEKIQLKLHSTSQRLNNFITTDNLVSEHGDGVAFVGRLSHEKGPDRFIQLARLFRHKTFDYYGQGPMEQALKNVAPDNVCFHGFQTNMAQVWPKIDVLVICSRYEGLPLVALEAMARGIIPISLNVGDMAKVIEHQRNGYLVDSESDLARCLRHWETQPECDKIVMRQYAKTTIENHYSARSLIPQFLQLYGCE